MPDRIDQALCRVERRIAHSGRPHDGIEHRHDRELDIIGPAWYLNQALRAYLSARNL